MRALVVSEPGHWSVEDVPIPKPSRGEVLVAPKAVGMCGTDLHILAGEFPPTPYPIVPGHEFAGVIADVGADVDSLVVGQRVAVDPSLFCGSCRYCQAGRGNLCARWGAIGDTVAGAFADYLVAPQANAYPIPDSMSFAAGALIEPLSCVVHGLDRLAIRAGADLLIVGGGTIGVSLLQAARSSGVARVDLIDTNESRLERAKFLGAQHVATSVDDAVAARGYGYEYVIEATGVPEVAQQALQALDRGGTLLIFGVSPESGRIDVSPFRIYNEEHSIIGSMAVLNSFEPALRMLASGAIDPETMVTHRFSLEDFDGALEAMRARQGLKIQIAFD